MTEQYWIGGFFVDLSRNQITAKNQSQTLAPKALAVLTCLAEHCGAVVTQDEILAKVWPESVVSPNTLQKSIAQLRKALGDDGKIQVYIKTHAKQGYSLESDVRWHDGIETSTTNSKKSSVRETDVSEVRDRIEKSNKRELSLPFIKANSKTFSIVSGIMILVIIGYLYFAPKFSTGQTSSLTFDRIKLLTATDDKEFNASYTPDGKYIVFHRYLDKQCVNKVWAKNTRTQEETVLTKDWGAYGRHSFSKDGKRLVFLAQAPCIEQPVSQKYCFDLASLDFETALETPQKTNVILKCKNTTVKKPIWLNNNNIVLMQYYSSRRKLINYSINNNKSTDLFNLDDATVIDYAYSSKDDLIAVITLHADNRHYIEMLKPDGNILSSHQIEYPQDIPKYRGIHPSFDPLNNQLIFSTGKQLYTLSYDGVITKIKTSFTDKMMQPEFHPDGEKTLMIKGPYDSDIVVQQLDQLAEKKPPAQVSNRTSSQAKAYASFQRSNLSDSHAIFQPGGDLIAFWSERSGDGQLWVSDGEGAQQLTHFPVDTLFGGIDWAHDGVSILVNTNYTLTQVFLDSSQKTIPLKNPVSRLYQWDSKNNSAIALIGIRGEVKIMDYNLTSSEYREISDKIIIWALRSEDGRLIYKDILDQFWQPGPVEDQRINALGGQMPKSKSFVVNGNVLYDINAKNQLWSYDLESEVFKIWGDVDKDVESLTDINQTHSLMTLKVSAKKEVVEVSISE